MANRFWIPILGNGTGIWDASNILNWSTASGGVGGASVPGSSDIAIFDGASGGGVVTLGYSPSVSGITMGAFTGTLAFSTFSPTLSGAFNASGTGTRTLDMGSANPSMTLTGNNIAIWTTFDATNMTLVRGNPVTLNYAGATGTRQISAAANEACSVDFNITGGTDTFSTAGSGGLHSIDFTGFSGTFTNSGRTTYGNVTLSATMIYSAGANAWVFAATTGTQTITSNGINMDHPITFNGSGGTFKLGDNVAVGTATSRAITLTAGTLDLNGKTLTGFGTFIPGAGSGTRVLSFNGGTYENTLATTTTIWNYSGTNFSTTGSGTIKISGSTTNIRTFAGGSITYANLWFTNATGSGTLRINDSNTFSDIKCVDINTQSLVFAAGTTNTVTTFTVTGAAGNLITINSAAGSTSTHALVKAGGGTIACDYLNIQHSVATPGSTWYAGTHSTNNQGTVTAGSGWIFTDVPVPSTSSGYAMMMGLF